MTNQQWTVYAFPKGAIKPFPDTREDYQRIHLEQLVEENTKLRNTWRLLFQPGAVIRHLNLERKIARLLPGKKAPSIGTWIYGTSLDLARTALYSTAIIEIAKDLYKTYTGSQ